MVKVYVAERCSYACALQWTDTEKSVCPIPHQPECKLQNRISELENEAQGREQWQAKQMQEMKSAYEQQNRKLFEFVDFVKHYFPYVEKLMPTIRFLRETPHIGDAVIRRLCTFKDVSIRGELYFREFNQHFKADKTVCSLKEDKGGDFELNIDGVSHVS